MASINPYITFNGNAEEAFNFYKSVFGGEFSKIVRFKDLPTEISQHFSDDESEKLMHIALPIGAHNVLIANDAPKFLGTVNENENRSKISVSAESKSEADRIFNALSDDGQIEVPMNDSPWGSYFGMFRDKYGIEWIIEFYS